MLHIFEDQWKSNLDECKSIICKSINGINFNCQPYVNNNEFIGDNTYPIFGNYEIISITEPEAHVAGKFTYYDCGKIIYKMKT